MAWRAARSSPLRLANPGDYIFEKYSMKKGLVISKEYARQHQYLDRELYYEVLVTTSENKSGIEKFLASDCEIVSSNIITREDEIEK